MPIYRFPFISVKLFITILLIIASTKAISQPKDNLSVFYSLIDSSVTQLLNSMPAGKDEIPLKTNLPGIYSAFENPVLSSIKNHNKKIIIPFDTNKQIIKYSIDEARTSYPETFRENIFGSLQVQRIISLKGSYSIFNNGNLLTVNSFSFINSDTVDYNQLNNLETQNLPFTQGAKPTEPLFSGFWEPLIALGTAAAVVYLFFKVRSK